jgi:hypothetical protein
VSEHPYDEFLALDQALEARRLAVRQAEALLAAVRRYLSRTT